MLNSSPFSPMPLSIKLLYDEMKLLFLKIISAHYAQNTLKFNAISIYHGSWNNNMWIEPPFRDDDSVGCLGVYIFKKYYIKLRHQPGLRTTALSMQHLMLDCFKWVLQGSDWLSAQT